MRAAWILALALAACAPVPSGEIVRMRAEAHIPAPPEAVYARVADPLHEADLRREAPTFTADGPLRIGTTYTETIDLGLVNNYQMVVRVTALDEPRRVRLESPADYPRVFSVEREFRPEAGGTRLVYIVDAEDRVVRDITLLPVPTWLAKAVYEAEMRSYLRRLTAAFAP